jgi:LysM repeat protein
MGFTLTDHPIIRTHGRPLCFAVGLILFSLGGLNVYREHCEHPGQRIHHFFAAVPGQPSNEETGIKYYLTDSDHDGVEPFSLQFSRIPAELLASYEPERVEKKGAQEESSEIIVAAVSPVELEKVIEPAKAEKVEKPAPAAPTEKPKKEADPKLDLVDGAYYKIRQGESLWEISRRYRISMNSLITFNNIRNPAKIQAGQKLFIPGVTDLAKGPDFIWPVRGRLTSKFGYRQHPMGGGRKFHRGIDVAAPVGKSVLAAKSGKVTYASRRGTLGLTVIIDHKDGFQTIYGHNSKILVKVGQKIEQGQQIAQVGSTGLSTGPHVHFEIRKGGRAVDPLPYLP